MLSSNSQCRVLKILGNRNVILTAAGIYKIKVFWKVTLCGQMGIKVRREPLPLYYGHNHSLFYPEKVGSRILHKSGTYVPKDTASESGR